MTPDEFIQLYYELFKGTEDCYAISYEWEGNGGLRRAYLPSNYSGDKEHTRETVQKVVADIGTEKYGIEAVTAHLQGKHFLGVYPIHTDSTVRFFALDFDKDEEYARKAAYRQQHIFWQEAGIKTYLERSRSGNGYHLWGFLEEPVDAGRLRFALAQFIETTETFDRMFPNQDSTSEQRPYGNLIALPLYGPAVSEGKGAFVRIDGQTFEAKTVEDQKEYVKTFDRIPKAKIDSLFKLRDETYVPQTTPRRTKDPEALEGIYKVVNPTVGCQWINWCREHPEDVLEPEWYALACQFAQLEGGRDMFHEFSALDRNRYDPSSTDAKFDHALAQNAPHTCQYIRDNLSGPPCDCDKRFPDHKVTHPFDLARVPFYDLVENLQLESEPEEAYTGISRVIQDTRAMYKNPNLFKGFKFGFKELDQYTELRPNDFIVFAARPGRGKSAWAVDLAYRVAKEEGKPVYIYSMEMTRDQFWMRLLARAAQVDAKRLQQGKLVYSEWRRILDAEKDLQQNPLPIYIDDSTYDATDIVNKAAEQIAIHGPGLVVIDYLQMATNHPGETDYQKNSRVPRQYKLLAKGMGVPVLCLAQMNREGEDLTEESETLDRVIEGSGKIEQYADIIFFLLGPRQPGIVLRVLVQHKDRHREAGHRIEFDFNQPTMTFESKGTWAMQAKAINHATKHKTTSGQVTARDFFSTP